MRAMERRVGEEHALPRGEPCRQHVDAADEVGDERGARVAVDLERRADMLDHAVVHHDDAVGHGQCLLLVVRDHDRRHAELALQAADLLAQVHAHDRVQRRQRLVQQQQPGRGGQRARQRDALLLPARQLRRVLGLAAGQADQLQQLGHALAHLGARHAPIDQPVGDVVGHRQVGEQRIGLEDDAVVALRRRQHRDVAPGHPDAAGAVRLEPGDDAQQRGLAAARRPEEADELALGDLQIDVAQRGEAAEILADAFESEIRRQLKNLQRPGMRRTLFDKRPPRNRL